MAAPLAFLLGWALALFPGAGVGRALSGPCTGFVTRAKGFPGPSPLLGTWPLTVCNRLSPDGATDADCMAGVGSGLVEGANLLAVPLGRRLTYCGREMMTSSWARDR